MPDIVNVRYAQTGQSISTNHMGMREMQARAFEAREAQYLLLKAPPASRVKEIVESDLNDLKAAILQDNTLLQALPGEFIDSEVMSYRPNILNSVMKR